MTTKQVWLNIETGEFSNSWGKEEHTALVEELINDLKANSPWRLIEYTCLSDDKFEFFNCMKLR